MSIKFRLIGLKMTGIASTMRISNNIRCQLNKKLMKLRVEVQRRNEIREASLFLFYKEKKGGALT